MLVGETCDGGGGPRAGRRRRRAARHEHRDPALPRGAGLGTIGEHHVGAEQAVAAPQRTRRADDVLAEHLDPAALDQHVLVHRAAPGPGGDGRRAAGGERLGEQRDDVHIACVEHGGGCLARQPRVDLDHLGRAVGRDHHLDVHHPGERDALGQAPGGRVERRQRRGAAVAGVGLPPP